MKISASILYALKLMGFTSKKSVSNAQKSLYGAIFGIGLSLVPLVTVMTVTDGMIDGISERIIELSSSHVRVVDYSEFVDEEDYPVEIENLSQLIQESSFKTKIVDTWPERQGIGIAVGSLGRSGASIRAVGSNFFSNPKAVKLFSETQGNLNFDAKNDAIIGKSIADYLGLKLGDRFRILTMRRQSSGSTVPKFTTFSVKAIVSSGYQELDALWIFIPFETGCSIMDYSSSKTFISIQTDNAFAPLDSFKTELNRFLPLNFYAHTWKDLNRSQFQSFNTTRILLIFIMFLIVFIAAINVSSALIMMVMEKRQEIAILKSMGASPSGIAFSFIFSGFLTGLGGLLVGVPLGIFISVNINKVFAGLEHLLSFVQYFLYTIGVRKYFSEFSLLDPEYYLQIIPVHLKWEQLLMVSGSVLILSVLVSVLPAWRAGQEKPLNIMRKF